MWNVFVRKSGVVHCMASISPAGRLSLLNKADYDRVRGSLQAVTPLLRIGRGMGSNKNEVEIPTPALVALVIESDDAPSTYELECHEKKGQ
jgi:hypothetical protein